MDCLSVDISEWDKPGILYGKTAKQCTREEVAREVWAQLKAALNDTGRTVLKDGALHSWFLDPGVDGLGTPNPTNDDELLIHPVGTFHNRPQAGTRVPNFFLAGDYVAVDIDLATMEGANASARRPSTPCWTATVRRPPGARSSRCSAPRSWRRSSGTTGGATGSACATSSTWGDRPRRSGAVAQRMVLGDLDDDDLDAVGPSSVRHEADDSRRRRIPGAARVRSAARRSRRGPGHPGDAARRGRGPARRDGPGPRGPGRRAPGRPGRDGDRRTSTRPCAVPTSSSPRSGSAASRDARPTSGSPWPRACWGRRRSARAGSRTGCGRCRWPCDIARRIAGARPRGLGHQLHQPGRPGHRGDGRVLGDRVIGICDSPVGLGRRVARAAGRRPGARPGSTTSGLNHLGWLRGLRVGGRDELPAAAGRHRGAGLLRGGPALRRRVAALAGRDPERVPALLLLQPRDRTRPTRRRSRPAARSCATSRRGFYAEVGRRRTPPPRWPPGTARSGRARGDVHGREPRGGGGRRARRGATWSRAATRRSALALMRAIARDERATLILNVRNRATLSVLDARGGDRGALPRRRERRPSGGASHPLPYHAVGLVTAVKAVEREVLAAAESGSRASRGQGLRAASAGRLGERGAAAGGRLRGRASGTGVPAPLNRLPDGCPANIFTRPGARPTLAPHGLTWHTLSTDDRPSHHGLSADRRTGVRRTGGRRVRRTHRPRPRRRARRAGPDHRAGRQAVQPGDAGRRLHRGRAARVPRGRRQAPQRAVDDRAVQAPTAATSTSTRWRSSRPSPAWTATRDSDVAAP